MDILVWLIRPTTVLGIISVVTYIAFMWLVWGSWLVHKTKAKLILAILLSFFFTYLLVVTLLLCYLHSLKIYYL